MIRNQPLARHILAPLALAVLLVTGAFAPAEARQKGDSQRTTGRSGIVAGSVDRSSIDLTATYVSKATLAWASGTIEVRSVAQVTNTSGVSIDRVELNTVAGAIGDISILASKVDGARVDVDVKNQTLVVPLGGILPRDATASVLIRYRATFRNGYSGRDFLWSRANGIISAHRWIPWVSRRTSFFKASRGDPFVTALSPSVRVTLVSDRPLKYATSGQRVSRDGLKVVYVAQNVRDFNFTAAPDFRKLRGYSLDGETTIDVYSRVLSRSHMLDYARRSLAAFEARLGRYPYPTLTVSESSGGTAMESPAHIWIPRTVPSSHVATLVVHEVAHQWFYAVVGNDQPAEPFADEAVVEFLTRWFFGAFRNSACQNDHLDRSIYGYSHGCFYEVVYVQGANFLDRLRDDMGNTRFWDALRDYWREHRWEFGGTYELLEALRGPAQAAGVNVGPRYSSRFPTLY